MTSKASRLSLKLAGLFAISFVLFFVLFFAYDLLSSFTESAAMAGQVNEQTTPMVIDPKIESDLAKVLSYDTNSDPEDVKDPFNDRGGLSNTVAASTASGVVQSTPTATGKPGVASVSGGGSGVAGRTGTDTSSAAVASPIEATKQRYDSWMGRSGINGDVPIDPRIFAIEDLLPVGIVDGGNGQQEVMFYSEAAGKTLSFPLGTMFFDGWLTELRPEGVVFSSNDDRRMVRLRSWARSIRNAG